MPLDSHELDQRLRKLSKSLKSLPSDPTADEVHDLRTRTRRVESILQALEMDSARNEKKLLAGLRSVRSRCGKVRDMDVLTGYVVGLGVNDDPNCVLRLVHSLGVERHHQARKLHSLVENNASELRRRLKQSRRKVDSAVDRFAKAKFDLEKSSGDVEEAPLHAMSVALRLAKELSAVSRLGSKNLHTYRLEVKRLRYVLEMTDHDSGEEKPFLQELKRAQDAIGEWHDWLALAGMAHDVLRHDQGCKTLPKIEETVQKKYHEALRVTEQMRQRYLPPSAGKAQQKSKRSKRSPVLGPVLIATSEIAS